MAWSGVDSDDYSLGSDTGKRVLAIPFLAQHGRWDHVPVLDYVSLLEQIPANPIEPTGDPRGIQVRKLELDIRQSDRGQAERVREVVAAADVVEPDAAHPGQALGQVCGLHKTACLLPVADQGLCELRARDRH